MAILINGQEKGYLRLVELGEKFFEKICRQVTRVHRCHSIAEYERLFAQIYNLHSRQPLDFKMSELKGFDYE